MCSSDLLASLLLGSLLSYFVFFWLLGFLLRCNILDFFRDTKYNVEVSSDVISVKLPEMQSAALDSPIHIAFANRLVCNFLSE